jgi:hypothetical protein
MNRALGVIAKYRAQYECSMGYIARVYFVAYIFDPNTGIDDQNFGFNGGYVKIYFSGIC